MNLILVLDETATVKGPRRDPQRPATTRPRRTIEKRRRQGDHHTIFTPERASRQGHLGYKRDALTVNNRSVVGCLSVNFNLQIGSGVP